MQFHALTNEHLSNEPGWLAGAELRPDRWRDDHTRSAIAEHGGELIAVGQIWTSRVHGDRYWVTIVVHPDHRRHGVGTFMFAHLVSLRSSPLALMARGYVDEPAMAFADSLGARTIQIVPPAVIDTAQRVNLRPLAGVISAASVPIQELRDANSKTYKWTHASWSPVSDTFQDVLNDDLEDALDFEATSVALDTEGRVRAAAMVYRDSEPPIVTAETTLENERDGERLVEGCLRAALDVLSDRGIATVEFDGHVSDPHFFPNWAKLEPTGRWFRLVEIPAND